MAIVIPAHHFKMLAILLGCDEDPIIENFCTYELGQSNH